MFAPYKFEKPEAPVKADPFSLDALIAWLRTKPGDEIYNFCSPDKCMLGQYTLEHGGRIDFDLLAYVIQDVTFPACSNDLEVYELQQFKIAQGKWPDLSRTFGAALSRALAIKAGQS